MALSDAVAFAVSAWALDEASGTRFDSVGSNDLTDNNTVGSATGMFGNAADLEDFNSESLTIADNADLSTGDVKFTLSIWFKEEGGLGASKIIACKAASVFLSQTEWRLICNDAPGKYYFTVSDGSGSTSGTVNSDVARSTDWHLVVATHDSDTNEIAISIDGETPVTASYSGGSWNSTYPFCLGQDGSDNRFFDGLIDDVVFLKGYCLSASEITELYNGGAGVAFADWDAGGGGGGHPAARRFGLARSGLWLPEHRPVEVGRNGAFIMRAAA